MARAARSFTSRTFNDGGAVLALLGAAALAAASTALLLGLAEVAQLLQSLPQHRGPIF